VSRRPTRTKSRPKSKKRASRRLAVPAPVTVISAGALCWRPAADGSGLEVLLVRSARWGDWSWPKGKVKSGETLPEAAVREVMEETGVRPRLGRPLPSVGYLLPDGRDKTVTYWAATVVETSERTAGDDEIAEVAWLGVEQARERLTRPSDIPPLEALLAHEAAGQLQTRALVVLRHAKARARAHWTGAEADRPLTSVGRTQANGLPGLLEVWALDHMVTSPWARCMQTLLPYLRERNAPDDVYAGVEVMPLLSEQGLRNDPERVPELLHGLVSGAQGSWLLCTHRPVLESVVAALAEASTPEAREGLPEANPWLGTGEALVAHIAGAEAGSIVAVERFRGQA
jgi:8-oxo-(d)GTP phosphatase